MTPAKERGEDRKKQGDAMRDATCTRTRLLAALAALAMTLGVCLTAAAPAAATVTDTGTIVIQPEENGSLKDRSFAAYRLADYESIDEETGPVPAYRAGENAAAYKTAVDAGLTAAGESADVASLQNLVGNQSSWGASSAYKFSIGAYESLYAAKVSPDGTIKCQEGTACEFSNLQFGYYLIAETGVKNPTQSVAGKPSQSYLLLASLQDEATKRTSVSAKSVTPSSHKFISEENGSLKLSANNTPKATSDADSGSTNIPDFEIGEPIWYTLQYTIPGKYAQDFEDHGVSFEYKLQDSMDKGIAFDGDVSLRVSTITDASGSLQTFSGAAYSELTPVQGASISQGAELSMPEEGSYKEWDFTVRPTTAAGYDALPAYSKIENYLKGDTVIYLTYRCHLTEKATIASTGNINNFNVTYTTGAYGDLLGDYSHTPQESPKVYTAGAMTVRKTDANDDTATLSGVEFCLTTTANLPDATACAGSEGHVTFTKRSNGWYYTADSGTDNTLTTDDKGEFTITGLGLKDYYLWETSVGDNTDYALAAEPWTISVTQNSATAFGDDEREHYYPDKNTNTPIDYLVSVNGGDSKPMSGDAAGTLPVFSITNRRVRGITLPTTGALGIGGLIIAGIVFLGGGIYLIVSRVRRETSDEV